MKNLISSYPYLSKSLAGVFTRPQRNENRSNNSDSPIIALGESWAYHIGQYLADKKYGTTSSKAGEQSILYHNGDITGLSSHLIALENYDPYYLNYPFNWIPKGVFYDMIDTRNDLTAIPRYVNIDDQVAGFSNHQFFNAFSSGITSVGDYKENLIQQNPNNQTTQVRNLFQQYGY